MPKNNLIRAFICIDFPSKVIKEVTRIQELIKNNSPFIGKLTEPENLHMTLKFLGEVEKEKIDIVKEKLSKINFPILNLKLNKVGIFSHGREPRIVWLKVIGNIFHLQKEIDNSLSNTFPKEERFMSHLTIARIKHTKDKAGFINYIKNIKPKPLTFEVNSFKLKSSELKPLGPVYTTIKAYSLWPSNSLSFSYCSG